MNAIAGRTDPGQPAPRPQRRSNRKAAYVVALALLAVGSLAYVIFTPAMPDLDEAVRLAEDGYFDESEAMLEQGVTSAPGQFRPRMLLAQVLVNRFDRRPDHSDLAPIRRALDHLEAIRPDTPSLDALVLLWKGKAERRLMRLSRARANWIAALKADPTVPEAAWGLLDLDYLEGRPDHARAVALAQFAVEPDPGDRAQLLHELLRQDAQPPASESLVLIFEPMLKAQPDDPDVRRGMGLALVRDGHDVDRGLDLLTAEIEAHPGDPDAWEAYLGALDLGNRADVLADVLPTLPRGLADDPRFARFQGLVAQERGDWKTAIAALRIALERQPHDPRLEYRLARCLRRLVPAQAAEADSLEACQARHEAAQPEAYPLYLEANEAVGLGKKAYPELIARLADQRERKGRTAEAAAWRSLLGGRAQGPPGVRPPGP
jgi:tetratricopeptide (TPR) repeat protein